MPPIVPRKRLRKSPPPDTNSSPQSKKIKEKKTQPARKATLYDALDAGATPNFSKNVEIALLNDDDDDDDDSSSLSSFVDEEFEDVPLAKRQKKESQESDDSGDEDVEFEDVSAQLILGADPPTPSGDLELTLEKSHHTSSLDIYGDKKGPTKREKKVRRVTHSIHVLMLLWHNAVRNSWLCDMEVQATMLSHVPPRMWEEFERWRRNSGLEKPEKNQPKQAKPTKQFKQTKQKPATRSKTAKSKAVENSNERPGSDWGTSARKLEEGEVDMSHGDPLFRLMQSLVSWWKQRFKVTAPGLRKWGYMGLERLDRLTKSYKADPENPDTFGERMVDRDDFRECARSCQGSRDVGAQLFVALLRGLGLDARLVANLQALGFGFTKYEIAEPESQKAAENTPQKSSQQAKTAKAKSQHSPQKNGASLQKKGGKTGKGSEKKGGSRPKRSKTEQHPTTPQYTDEDLDVEYKDTDDESVIDVELMSDKKERAGKKFDSDLEHPLYWVEVLSPVTNKYLPVDPIVKGTVATNRELVESFEPRGIKADKARLIIAYVVGYCNDGTAKDVTVRYLKRQVLPGRTKSTRTPLAKIPVHNKHGKVKHYETFDWFKSAMSGYRRGTKLHPFTEIDDLEDVTDLKPKKPEKKEVKEGEETLQYYKQSSEFVLQKHLKREEALRPEAKRVKVFQNKVKGGKVEEEDVYLRKDVLNVKSQETWHKQGRAPLPGEQPLKHVPYRAATTNRRRELLEAERATGGKVLQGLFSFEQTEWIIPPPIKDGIIPKNGYGNIDLFAEHMCPEGAVHVPFRGAIKVCKRIGIDYAEAVVDFEFGNRMAVPVIRGVVVAVEYHDQVMVELEKDEAERARKEDEKRRKAAIGMWRKFLMGMRIVEQIKRDYGEFDEKVSVFSHNKGNDPPAQDTSRFVPVSNENDEEMGGGFLPDGFVEEEEKETLARQTSSYFPAGGDEDDDQDVDDGLIMEDSHNVGEQTKPDQTKVEDESDLSEVPSEPSEPKPQRRTSTRKKTTSDIGMGRITRGRGRRPKMIEELEQESSID